MLTLASAVRPQLSSRTGCFATKTTRPINARLQRTVVVRAEDSLREKFAVPAAAMLGAALLFAAFPDEAEAARSGGRVGGSSGFRAPRAAPRAAPSAPSRTQNNTNVYVAPPVVGGYGFGMPMFGGGFGYGFGMPMFGFGMGMSSILNFMLLSVVISVAFTAISNFTNKPSDSGSDKKKKFDDEDW